MFNIKESVNYLENVLCVRTGCLMFHFIQVFGDYQCSWATFSHIPRRLISINISLLM